MIKQLNQNSCVVSPFLARKAWNFYNVENDDCILLEPFQGGVEAEDTALSLDYVDYSSTPLLNRDCDIALEQQASDVAIYEEGKKQAGYFMPTEEKNQSGTYKRLVYDQVAKNFYNTYKNPLQIFGIDHIDFALSNTNRYLADEFIMFSIPREIMGERLVPGTIRMYDTLLDDNIEVTDDTHGNLVAKRNLFSKIQEVRKLGNSIEE